MLRKPFIASALSPLLISTAMLLSLPPALAGKSSTQKSSKEATVQLSPSELFKLISPSVFIVETVDKTGSVVALGSGVAVSPNEVVTNVHVVEDGAFWTVRHGDKSWTATVTNADSEHDLCKLKVDHLGAKPTKVRASSSLEIGEKVYAVGAPEGLELTLSDGLVSGIRDFGSSRVIQTTAAISKGSSGGGLFDAKGQLVGIITFFAKEGQSLNFALPAELIANLSSQSFKRENIQIEGTDFQAFVWGLAGNEYRKQNKFQEARAALLKALELKRDYPEAWALYRSCV